MTATNTATRYGNIAKSFHWLTALLIVTLIPLGIIANGLPYETAEQLAQKAQLFSLHKTLGVLVFFVALGRILWALSQIKPEPLHPERRLESFAAETVHWLLYGSLLIVPLTGWIHHASTEGFAPIWWPFGQNFPFVPKSETLAATTAGLHIMFERVLALSIFLHVAGALKHHVIDRDTTLKRMWFGKTESAPNGARHSILAPFGAAVAACIAALFIGAGIGAYDAHDTHTKAVELADVQSDWVVQDGTLAISITQFGSVVSGQFDDWTAAIQFDPTILNGKSGSVDVTISVPSLTLGSVTSQAMGPDYFDASTYATAHFVADIVPVVDGYSAEGTLQIKDAIVPLAMPFGLSIDGDTAFVTAKLTLDRRDFGIGANMADESSLKFAVDVTIDLTAQRIK